ncbi:Small glutamine-rich tetratricopeptide repeat-containing protein alpha, partial [Cucurbita argyrosperma subsp. argyrosperma]
FSSTSISLTPIRAQNQEIRVCTNRTCRRQGSFQTLETLSVSKSLEALALRKRAECEVEDGNFSQADLLLSKAIELKPCGGIHIIFKDRSIVRLALGNHAGALEDANEALRVAPRYPEAYICQGDVFLSMDHFDSAEMSYSTALEIDPSIRRSKSFKARVAKLQEKLNAVRTQ